MPCHCRWLGSKLKPKAARRPTASRARAAVTTSKANLRRVHLQREPHTALLEDVQDGLPQLGEAREARVDGGRADEYSRCQMGEPVKPQTTGTSRPRAARAVRFIASTAQARLPSASPASAAGAKASERSSFGSQTSCPARWFEIAQQPSPCASSSARRAAQ